MPKVYLIDVTNRDAVQSARVTEAKLEKTMINKYLSEFGVYQIEFGFPVTDHEIRYLNANLELAEIGVFSETRLSGWLRAIPQDVETCFKLVPKIKHLNLSISTSDQMIATKFGGKLDRAAVIREMEGAVKLARNLGAESIGVNAEDASRTNMNYLIEFSLAAKEVGADRVRYCDTLGYDSPFSIYERIGKLAENIRIPIELHCHNDLGMAVANTVAGVKGALDVGVDAYPNTTILGIGERAGNADLFSTVLAFKFASGFEGKIDLDLEPSLIWEMANYVALAFNRAIPENQPAVGKNAFAHSAGIHVDATLKGESSSPYELYDFRLIGRGEPEIKPSGREIIFGQYSGLNTLLYYYRQLGIKPRGEKEDRIILSLARDANIHLQRPLVEKEFRFLINYPKMVAKLMTFTPAEDLGLT